MAERRVRWMFTNDQLANSPSRNCGIDARTELSYRQQAACLISDMGQKLDLYAVSLIDTFLKLLAGHVLNSALVKLGQTNLKGYVP